MESPYNTCQWCNNAIAYGNAMLTINRNIEQVDKPARHPDGVVNSPSKRRAIDSLWRLQQESRP